MQRGRRQEEVRDTEHCLALRAAAVRSHGPLESNEEARGLWKSEWVKGTDGKKVVKEREGPKFE